MTQGKSIEHKKRCKNAQEANKPAEICQYLGSSPDPYQCKLISVGLVLIGDL